MTDECSPANISGIEVGCLLYADDLVMVSETSVGLRESLGKLDQYCNRWELQINSQKSEIVVFKKDKHANQFFSG